MIFDSSVAEIHVLKNAESSNLFSIVGAPLAYIIAPSEGDEVGDVNFEYKINDEEFAWRDPSTSASKTYHDLRFTQDDKSKIHELITTIARNNKATLLFKYKSHLEKLGDELKKTVHPLKFMHCIFSSSELKSCMKEIYNDYFKWSNFKSGFISQMEGEEAKDNFSVYSLDFAKDLNIQADKILPYFNRQDWGGLLKFLICR